MQYMQGGGGRQNELDVFFYALVWIFHSTSSAACITSGSGRNNLLFHSTLHLQGRGSGSAPIEQNLKQKFFLWFLFVFL